jgi:hypothetical protein
MISTPSWYCQHIGPISPYWPADTLLLLVGDYPIMQRVPCEKYFGCMALWKWNPEVLGSLWLMASATWAETISADGLHDWGRLASPFLIIRWHLPCS